LIEYSVFSLLVYWIFASDIDVHETTLLAHSNSHINPEDRPDIEWSQWVRDVFNIMDLFHDLTPTEGDLTQKLNDDVRPSLSVSLDLTLSFLTLSLSLSLDLSLSLSLGVCRSLPTTRPPSLWVIGFSPSLGRFVIW
jgi:hypothetical protein